MDAPEFDSERWIECGPDFIGSDVIRFWEPVWKRSGPRRGVRSVRIGDRMVIAQVIGEDDEGWVYLAILKSSISWSKEGYERAVRPEEEGRETRRQRRNIKGRVERLLWEDEGARLSVVSDLAGSPGARLSARKRRRGKRS
jgi:hypothetical protein